MAQQQQQLNPAQLQAMMAQQQQQQQLNPAQLQAMYTQQLMMQQQYQQMQLALAMQQQGGQQMPRNPNVIMAPGGSYAAATAGFSFLDSGAQPQKKKEDKQFDFVQDAIKKEKK